jgi:Protein of unknown function (DUF3141)
VVLCSKGDNFTPPQQALGWILDLYDSVDEIRAYGQTIVYTINESIGHLGIFVSSRVANKEHEQFAGRHSCRRTTNPEHQVEEVVRAFSLEKDLRAIHYWRGTHYQRLKQFTRRGGFAAAARLPLHA